MSDTTRGDRPDRTISAPDLAALRREAGAERSLDGVASGAPMASRTFTARADESPGFAYLAAEGARAVRAFKLLEVGQTRIADQRETADLSIAEWKLLQKMLGAEALDAASRAYADCKAQTRDLENLTELDTRAAWRLTELVHLIENVMLYGRERGLLSPDHAPHVLRLLIRDFGEYFGLLCDDVDDSRGETLARQAQVLVAFRQSPFYRERLPVDAMTRLSLDDDVARRLLDYEIARGIAPHPLDVKERVIRGDADGRLAGDAPVELNTHRLRVVYARDLDAGGLTILNAALPVLAVSVFEGFASLAQAEDYIARRQREIRLEEQQCFALLECLRHFNGRVPPHMKEFKASDVTKAAQAVYGQRERERTSAKATTLGGMLRETLSGAYKAVTRPVTFEWPEDRTMYRVAGYPETVAFFAQRVSIRAEEPDREPETFLFLCHAHTDVDPDADHPLMFEYQTVIGDGLLFDAHAAAKNLFEGAPPAFKRTLQAGPAVTYAKEVVHPGEREASVDMEEVKLLGTWVALDGGMRSWLGQHYLLSDEGANIFVAYPDVRETVGRLGATHD